MIMSCCPSDSGCEEFSDALIERRPESMYLRLKRE